MQRRSEVARLLFADNRNNNKRYRLTAGPRAAHSAAEIGGPGPTLPRLQKPLGAHAGSLAACGEAADVFVAKPLGSALGYK